MRWNIIHLKYFDTDGKLRMVCNRKVGEVFKDYKGTKYQVQKDYSIRRIS